MRNPKTSHMGKPWYNSLTIKSALATGLAILSHPAISGILPAHVASAIAVVGAVATTIGMRRAIPNPPE